MNSSKEVINCSNPIVRKIQELKGSYETKVEMAINLLKTLRDEEIEEIISELARKLGLNLEPPQRRFLLWEEIREIHKSGLIFFGSHTGGHKILTTLTDREIRDELRRSREKLIAERVVDPTFIPFCYPNGNYNERITKMVKEAGYALAVTTESGWNHPESDPFTLRRIAVHQDMTSTEGMLGCRIAGIF